MSPAALGQTITVVNKSGKVVSTSKHLVNVFKEAKSAYLERKAEIKAARDEHLERKHAVKQLDSDARPLPVPNDSSSSPRSLDSEPPARHPSARHPSNHRSQRSDHYRDQKERRRSTKEPSSERDRSHRPPVERGFTDSFYTNDRPRQRSAVESTSPLKFMEDAEREARGKELVRRRSLSDVQSPPAERSRASPKRSSTTAIDMDLAYGELPPPLPSRNVDEERELKVKVSSLQRMLDEANCLHNSATAIIKSLENNPDAMAAVALTMAEISNIVAKIGPGALTALKASFPAVVALLASPEFLIAAGVGVGITVIALGGYKIIKRLKAKKAGSENSATERNGPSDELEEIQSDVDLDRIELWRRGIADVEAESGGTSVEGEFVTPGAAKELRKQGKLSPNRKSTTKGSSKDKPKEKHAKEGKAERGMKDKDKKRDLERREKQERRDRKEKEVKDRKEKKGEDEGEKKLSGLALMFKNRRNDGRDKDLLI